ncbi:MAG: sulfotransferase, partial [Ilumatobacteraceae bacterium]
LRWYRSHFPTSTTLRRRRNRTGAAFTAEASPYYFFHPLGAERATAALPDTTFVLMLRDPIERTVSPWAEHTRNGVERLRLAEAIEAEPRRVGDDGRLLAEGALGYSESHEQQSYGAQSEYADSLDRWYEAAGRERVVVLFSEDYYRDPASVLDGLADRLGVPPFPPAIGVTHRNAAPRPADLDPALERRLVTRFAPDVERVAALVDRHPPWPRFTTELQETTGGADG